MDDFQNFMYDSQIITKKWCQISAIQAQKFIINVNLLIPLFLFFKDSSSPENGEKSDEDWF